MRPFSDDFQLLERRLDLKHSARSTEDLARSPICRWRQQHAPLSAKDNRLATDASTLCYNSMQHLPVQFGTIGHDVQATRFMEGQPSRPHHHCSIA